MRAKPDMKPWVHTDKNRMSSVGAALTERAFVLRLGSAAPMGLNKCVETINPGLAPWAMQEYRPYRAHLCFLHQSTNPSINYLVILMRLPCVVVSARTRFSEYDVLVSVSTRKYFCNYVYLFQ